MTFDKLKATLQETNPAAQETPRPAVAEFHARLPDIVASSILPVVESLSAVLTESHVEHEVMKDAILRDFFRHEVCFLLDGATHSLVTLLLDVGTSARVPPGSIEAPMLAGALYFIAPPDEAKLYLVACDWRSECASPEGDLRRCAVYADTEVYQDDFRASLEAQVERIVLRMRANELLVRD
jgi:hypothetical protein